jgi:hypothetical protein
MEKVFLSKLFYNWQEAFDNLREIPEFKTRNLFGPNRFVAIVWTENKTEFKEDSDSPDNFKMDYRIGSFSNNTEELAWKVVFDLVKKIIGDIEPLANSMSYDDILNFL